MNGFGLSEQAGWQWGITLAGVLCLGGATLWWWIRPEQSADRLVEEANDKAPAFIREPMK